MKTSKLIETLSRVFISFFTFAVASLTPSKKTISSKTTKSEDSKMRKSITIALILAAVAGALVTVYFYLARRERELNEYEEILFSDDLGDDLGEISNGDLTDEPIID